MQKRKLTKRGQINLMLFVVILVLAVSIFVFVNIGNNYNLDEKIAQIQTLLLENKLDNVTTVLAEINENVNLSEYQNENNIIKDSISSYMNTVNDEYKTKNISYEKAVENIKWAESTGYNTSEAQVLLDNVDELYVSEESFIKGEELYKIGDYDKAIENFSKVSENDLGNKQKVNEYINTIKNDFINKAKEEAQNSNYKKAILILSGINELLADAELLSLIDDYDAKSKELVKYTGLVEHIFYHDLVIDPVRAFTGKKKGFYDFYFVSTDEYRAMLDEMYKNNYVLVDIYSLFDIVDGKTVLNEIYLPEGKKPLIISTDDMNYYEIDRPYGLADKAVIDSDGNLGHLYTDAEGNQTIRYDADTVTITEQFVKENPDFSFNGAKLCLGFTGYEGLLGYKTNELDSPDYEKEKGEVLKVIDKLKQLGYRFASHSYYHYDMPQKSLSVIKNDTEKWLKEVGSLLGEEIQVFLYPLGEGFRPGDEKLNYMVSKGFRFFGEVGNHIWIQQKSNALIQGRRHVDGITLKRKTDLETLFDAEIVANENRPWLP